MFSYSERPGTMALKIGHSVSPEEKHRRSQRLFGVVRCKMGGILSALHRNRGRGPVGKVPDGRSDAWLYSQLYPGGIACRRESGQSDCPCTFGRF